MNPEDRDELLRTGAERFDEMMRRPPECRALEMELKTAMDCDGWTCLFHLRSERVAHFLLEQGADPGIADQCGALPEDWERVPMSVRQRLRDQRIERRQANP